MDTQPNATVFRLLPSQSRLLLFRLTTTEPLLHAREGTTEGAQLELFDWQRMQPMLYEEEEMVNSTCRVSKDCYSMWTDGLEFSRKPMGPEGGHARWRNSLNKVLKMCARSACSGSHETFTAAGDRV